MFTPKTIQEILVVADEFELEPAALLAVAEVESGGRVYAVVEDRPEPLIRFEGHYFDVRLPPQKQARARAEALASPTAGAIPNPRTQAGRWRILARAAAIDRVAAYESVSWGLGQVMGSHWKWLGYDSVDDLVREARSGAAGQARLMARYIEKSRLTNALTKRDWHAFARGYNGPAYRRNNYHNRMATAYARYVGAPAKEKPGAVLRIGSKGLAVRKMQLDLVRHGYLQEADGLFGPRTETAVREFQRRRGLADDGIVGVKTLAALRLPAAQANLTRATAIAQLAQLFRST